MFHSNITQNIYFSPEAHADIPLPKGSNVQTEFNAPLSFHRLRGIKLYKHTGGEGDPEGSLNAEELAQIERERAQQRMNLKKERMEDFKKNVSKRVTKKEKENRAVREEKMHKLENKALSVLEDGETSAHAVNISRQRIRAKGPGAWVSGGDDTTISGVNVTGNVSLDASHARDVSVLADVVDDSNENEVFALKEKWNDVYASVRRHYSEEERQRIKDKKHREREKIRKEKEERAERLRLEKERERLEAMKLKAECERMQRAKNEVATKNFEHQLTLDLSKRQERKREESNRYVEALKEKLLEKIEAHNITLPPLCNCGLGPLDNHAENCANNCVFYNNPKEYTRALADLLVAMDVV